MGELKDMSANNGYLLFLDDIRDPIDCMQYMLGRIFDINMYRKPEWRVVRSYKEFRDVVLSEGLPSFVSFDHDLAEAHYMLQPTSAFPDYYDDGTYKEKTGYDCAAFLVEYCIDNALCLPPYAIHSMNPSGTENIKALLGNYKRYSQC